MSYFKLDLDYDPNSRRLVYEENKEPTIQDIRPIEPTPAEKADMVQLVESFVNNLPKDMQHMYALSKILFRTSTNVFDSISFLDKFNQLYIATLKKTFPDLDETVIAEITEKMESIRKYVDISLKNGNVENKYLIPITLGMMEALLQFDNY